MKLIALFFALLAIYNCNASRYFNVEFKDANIKVPIGLISVFKVHPKVMNRFELNDLTVNYYCHEKLDSFLFLLFCIRHQISFCSCQTCFLNPKANTIVFLEALQSDSVQLALTRLFEINSIQQLLRIYLFSARQLCSIISNWLNYNYLLPLYSDESISKKYLIDCIQLDEPFYSIAFFSKTFNLDEYIPFISHYFTLNLSGMEQFINDESLPIGISSTKQLLFKFHKLQKMNSFLNLLNQLPQQPKRTTISLQFLFFIFCKMHLMKRIVGKLELNDLIFCNGIKITKEPMDNLLILVNLKSIPYVKEHFSDPFVFVNDWKWFIEISQKIKNEFTKWNFNLNFHFLNLICEIDVLSFGTDYDALTKELANLVVFIKPDQSNSAE